jgi:hypothetical protein
MARQGDRTALTELENEPVCPEEVEYLVEWVYKLHGRSGVGMGGVSPLTYSTIEAWADLMGIELLDTLEVEALLILDGVMLTEEGEPAKDDTPILKQRPSWPSRKQELQD